MGRQSRQDLKKDFLNVFGPALGEKYYVLHNQVIIAHMNWAMMRKLVKDQERQSLLRKTGRYFFVEAHRVFVNDVILRLSRLVDRARQGGQDNLSLYALLDDISDPTLKSKIETLIDEAKSKIAPLKEHRHKRIAHFDLHVAPNDPNFTLQPISNESVDEALSAVGEVLEQLREEYTGISRIQIWVPANAEQDIEHLLFYLEAGLSEGKSYGKKLLERRLKRDQSAQD